MDALALQVLLDERHLSLDLMILLSIGDLKLHALDAERPLLHLLLLLFVHVADNVAVLHDYLLLGLSDALGIGVDLGDEGLGASDALGSQLLV